ncbi:uncharacterized protein LOC135499141 [Lineus longissimus]|uniref:uncharacterized protein LOC135499141 n=1 Tax=Lineus longissimus TaxID=88925 RepID=UPI00315D118F
MYKNVKYFTFTSKTPVRLGTIKKRKPSAYNIFIKDKMKTMKDKPPGEQFRACAKEWNALSATAKKGYQDKRELLDVRPTNERERMARVEFLWRKLDEACQELGTYGTDVFLLS